MALLRRVAAKSLGVEAPSDPRPLPSPVGRDTVPVEVAGQGGAHGRQALALDQHRRRRRSSGRCGEEGEGAVAVVGGAQGIEGFSLRPFELAGDLGEQSTLRLGTR